MTRSTVDDVEDPRLADYRHLNDADLRRAHDEAAGVCIGEGEIVLRTAVEVGADVRSVLVSEKRLDALGDVLARLDDRHADVLVAPQDLLEQIVGFRLHRGVVAVIGRPRPRSLDEVVGDADRVLVVEGVNDHENLGALLRNAAGLGAGAVVADPTTADPLYRRAIRVSMGNALRVPWHRATAWPATLDELVGLGFVLAALTPSGTDLSAVDLAEIDRLALLVGAEGPGLSDGALTRADHRLAIPMAAGVDSLNVATAAAIALHAARPPQTG